MTEELRTSESRVWLPIESAPKNRRILACHREIKNSHCIVIWNDVEKCFAELDGLLRQPTHYQELDKVPE